MERNKFAVATNSGTAALHMALVACDVGCGDEVIVTAYSWSSSATCILHHNAIPVFVDINFDTINMDESLIERAITKKTKAIIAVHLHGLPMNMEKVMAIARKHKLKVVEDACQAHGATFKGRKVGTWGHCAAFSFNQNKCLCTGEGGMFVTDNEEMLQEGHATLVLRRNAHAAASARDYHAYALGWMYRMADLNAAFGRASCSKLDKYQATLKENAEALAAALKGTPESHPADRLQGRRAQLVQLHHPVRHEGPRPRAGRQRPSATRSVTALQRRRRADRRLAEVHSAGDDGLPGEERLRPRLSVVLRARAAGEL